MVQERLRLARMSRGLTIEAMAKQTGVRAEWLRAIDAGRFNELPAGIYARSAMRAYAASLNLNVDEILELTSSLLPTVDDPIAGMRRLNRISTPTAPIQPVEQQPSALPDWRVIAASVIDAGAMALGLLVLLTCTIAMGLPMSTLDHSAAGPIFVVMLLVTGLYFIVFGGIVGQTIGEYLIRGGEAVQAVPVNLQIVANRTRDAILRDWFFIERFGEWVGRSIVANWHSPLAHFHK
jgi:transcriptional regulator with XRE-family HTH domain